MMTTRNVVVLWLMATTLVSADQISSWSNPSNYFIHVLNGLSNVGMLVHCKSKDDDLGSRRLLNRGDDYQWNFNVNVWGTTLFWCNLEKPDAYVSFEVFWPESKNLWLRHRCGSEGTCIWTAKDDGIYLTNIPANVDEFVHKWIPTK